MDTAANIVREFRNAFDSAENAQNAIKSAALHAALYVSSCGQVAIDSLSAASDEKLSKRIIPALARFACANYSLEFTDSGTARLIALRDTDAEKRIDNWSALPVFHNDYLEKGFKPVFRIPSRVWTWQECRQEFVAILEKRGLASYAEKLESLDIDAI